MAGVFCWSDGWSWNASILHLGLWWLAAAVILGLCMTLASILLDANFVARAKRRRDGSESAPIWWRSNT